MLPVITLHTPEPLNLELAPDTASPLLPEDADALAGTFADILTLSLEDRPAGAVDGRQLPGGGNRLPLLPPDVAVAEVTVGPASTAPLPAGLPSPAPIGPVPTSARALPPRTDTGAAEPTLRAPAAPTTPLPDGPPRVAVPAVTLPADSAAVEALLTRVPGDTPAPASAPRPGFPAPSEARTRPVPPPVDTTALRLHAQYEEGPRRPETPTMPPINVPRPAIGRRTGAAEISLRRPEVPVTPTRAQHVAPSLNPTPSGSTPTISMTSDALPAADNATRTGQDIGPQLVRVPAAGDTALPTPARNIELAVQQPVQQPGWGTAVAERVTMMAGSQVQNAEIRLTPPELGPLRVQVAVDDGNAHVNFQAQHALTREAIELAMPRLREMLAEQGLTLGQATITDHELPQGGRDARPRADDTGALSDPSSEARPAPEDAVAQRSPDGLVDTFA